MLSDKSNERMEQEARESLVASELSAKMKHWRNQPPAGGPGRWTKLLLLLLLLGAGGVAWWLWPKTNDQIPQQPVPPTERQPAPAPQQPSEPTPPPLPDKQIPIAQKTPAANRYLALAQTNYRSPDFAAEIRGDAATGQNALDPARRALAENRPADALQALQNVPAGYESDAVYLRGHALFGLKNYAGAADAFGQLAGSVRYGEAAQWYEILALLPDYEHKKPLILKKLKKLAEDEGHTFHREAKRLSGEI